MTTAANDRQEKVQQDSLPSHMKAMYKDYQWDNKKQETYLYSQCTSS